MSYETIRYERDGHVAVLTYDRPEQRNAVSRKMNAELHDAWARFRDSDDEFVLVITGTGEAFCGVAREIAELPQGAIRSDKETMVRNVGRPYEEQLRTELEMTLSMFMRRDSHAPRGPGIQGGAGTPEWPHHGL